MSLLFSFPFLLTLVQLVNPFNTWLVSAKPITYYCYLFYTGFNSAFNVLANVSFIFCLWLKFPPSDFAQSFMKLHCLLLVSQRGHSILNHAFSIIITHEFWLSETKVLLIKGLLFQSLLMDRYFVLVILLLHLYIISVQLSITIFLLFPFIISLSSYYFNIICKASLSSPYLLGKNSFLCFNSLWMSNSGWLPVIFFTHSFSDLQGILFKSSAFLQLLKAL